MKRLITPAMLAPHPSTLSQPPFRYRNNSCLGNKYAGYRHICGVKTAKSGKLAKAYAIKGRPHQIHQIAHPIYLPALPNANSLLQFKLFGIALTGVTIKFPRYESSSAEIYRNPGFFK